MRKYHKILQYKSDSDVFRVFDFIQLNQFLTFNIFSYSIFSARKEQQGTIVFWGCFLLLCFYNISSNFKIKTGETNVNKVTPIA